MSRLELCKKHRGVRGRSVVLVARKKSTRLKPWSASRCRSWPLLLLSGSPRHREAFACSRRTQPVQWDRHKRLRTMEQWNVADVLLRTSDIVADSVSVEMDVACAMGQTTKCCKQWNVADVLLRTSDIVADNVSVESLARTWLTCFCEQAT